MTKTQTTEADDLTELQRLLEADELLPSVNFVTKITGCEFTRVVGGKLTKCGKRAILQDAEIPDPCDKCGARPKKNVKARYCIEDALNVFVRGVMPEQLQTDMLGDLAAATPAAKPKKTKAQTGEVDGKPATIVTEVPDEQPTLSGVTGAPIAAVAPKSAVRYAQITGNLAVDIVIPSSTDDASCWCGFALETDLHEKHAVVHAFAIEQVDEGDDDSVYALRAALAQAQATGAVLNPIPHVTETAPDVEKPAQELENAAEPTGKTPKPKRTAPAAKKAVKPKSGAAKKVTPIGTRRQGASK